ncbi:MAG: adenylate/guanylate cyclase domain-containing protein [Chloroflexi bacterium]|nr:adenylate/guanylate cyclase domain-containing protein [Chloroflexota bacterium]
MATKDNTESLVYSVEQKERISQLKTAVEGYNKERGLQYLLNRVNEQAKKRLETSGDFFKEFEDKKSCDAVIMSVDIRRSTELMLKARTPQLYAEFIKTLCNGLTQIILTNFGVFDKFMGDGILSFFPEFYSGEDAIYYAVKSASECHEYFVTHYSRNRHCFTSIMKDIGLGIGIDFGNISLVKMQDTLTVIGDAVVYACRMSGAQAGLTSINQRAYEKIVDKYSKFINCTESEIVIKHEGPLTVYNAILSKISYKPKLPNWFESVK